MLKQECLVVIALRLDIFKILMFKLNEKHFRRLWEYVKITQFTEETKVTRLDTIIYVVHSMIRKSNTINKMPNTGQKKS